MIGGGVEAFAVGVEQVRSVEERPGRGEDLIDHVESLIVSAVLDEEFGEGSFIVVDEIVAELFLWGAVDDCIVVVLVSDLKEKETRWEREE